jgi:uncharacterized membrane protein YfcA
MGNSAVATKFRESVVPVAAALVCCVAIVAMFSQPGQVDQAPSVSQGEQAPAAECDPALQLTAEAVLGLCVIGLISGTFGGMLGMGGGMIKMSLLLLFFTFHPGVSRFAALLSYFVVAAGASYRYLKLRFVMMDVVKILIPSSILGIVIGAIVGHHLPRDVMTMLLGVFLLFISVVMVRKILSHYQDVLLPADSDAQAQEHAIGSSHSGPVPVKVGWRIALCGLPGGFLSAMLGISGGVVSNPLQQVLVGIPIKNSIANTLLKASVTVPIACIMIMIMGVEAGHFDFWTPVLVALCLIPGSIIGSQLGPALTRRMSAITAHTLFGVVAFCMGICMLFFTK